MRTPAGKECRFFYGDYYRGRNNEDCRLLSSASPPIRWKPDLCTSCPVPDILLANACQRMELIPRLDRPFPFIKQQVGVTAVCSREGKAGFDPHVGCGSCHPLPEIFHQFDES
jgi:hypothetical protein